MSLPFSPFGKEKSSATIFTKLIGDLPYLVAIRAKGKTMRE
jgi:hypothetical protein